MGGAAQAVPPDTESTEREWVLSPRFKRTSRLLEIEGSRGSERRNYSYYPSTELSIKQSYHFLIHFVDYRIRLNGGRLEKYNYDHR